jgi:hypothetical protein
VNCDDLRAICTSYGVTVTLSGFVREADAAALLGVCTRTLRTWRLSAIAPHAVRVGSSWRYSLAELACVLTPSAECGRIRKNTEESDIDADPGSDEAAPSIQLKRGAAA